MMPPPRFVPAQAAVFHEGDFLGDGGGSRKADDGIPYGS